MKTGRRKGKAGEKEIAEILKGAGYEARRGLVFMKEPDVITNLPFHVEVKRSERLNIYAAIEQAAKYAAKKDKPYIVAFRKNHGEWHVCLKLDEFLKNDHNAK